MRDLLVLHPAAEGLVQVAFKAQNYFKRQYSQPLFIYWHVAVVARWTLARQPVGGHPLPEGVQSHREPEDPVVAEPDAPEDSFINSAKCRMNSAHESGNLLYVIG